MMPQTIQLSGRHYVIVEREEYDRLTTLAKAPELPPLPRPNAKGNYPALEYIRASIARDIVRERVKAGLTQRELAELSGVRVETICRVETAKHAPSVPTIEKLDRALKTALARKQKRGKSRG